MAHNDWTQNLDERESGHLKINDSEINSENLSSNPKFSEIQNTTSQTGNVLPTHDTIGPSVLNRPPKPPGPALGPYFQFITTDLEKMIWVGSALVFRHVSLDQPKIQFFSAAKVDYNWEVLYENLFNMRAYRINLQVELRTGEGDEKVVWLMDWGDYTTGAIFYIARYDQKWRGGFFSCNGFDASTSKQTGSNPNYDSVWNHLHSVHEETPLHLLLWGGDQNYIDFIFEDILFLRDWTTMEWDKRWTYDFDHDSKIEVEQYYFNSYAENWERRFEMKRALQSIPSLMMWDDHDIFDGAGSYPPPLHDSPIMLGLFEMAQKMRLLFQHHTTPEKARQHSLFGHQGYNFFARCGPKLAVVGADGRTERDVETVQHEKTWDMIFDKLDNEMQGVEQLLVLFSVPFSYVRFRSAELALGGLKKVTSTWRNIPLVKETNSIFGLPELEDDLLDEWTHASHLVERNRALLRFQAIAEKKKVRITFFSGDVHCCAISRFQTSGQNPPSPTNDTKLMYQIISSAIVNMPPSKMFLRIAHFWATTWYPVANTEETILNFFQRSPQNGRGLYLQKLLPNRNWCYFEQSVAPNLTAPAPAPAPVQTGFFGNWFSWNTETAPVNSTSDRNAKANRPVASSQESHEPSASQHKQVVREQQQSNSMKIRLWLESTIKQTDTSQFAGYDLLIPNLE